MVCPAGIEPATSWLKVKSSTDWVMDTKGTGKENRTFFSWPKSKDSTTLLSPEPAYGGSGRIWTYGGFILDRLATGCLKPLGHASVVVGEGFEPSKANANGFTARPLWPLGNPTFNWSNAELMEPAKGLEPPTCWLQISCSSQLSYAGNPTCLCGLKLYANCLYMSRNFNSILKKFNIFIKIQF